MIKKILKNKIIFRAIIITEILATLVFAVFIIENYRKSDSGDPKYDVLAQEEVQIPEKMISRWITVARTHKVYERKDDGFRIVLSEEIGGKLSGYTRIENIRFENTDLYTDCRVDWIEKGAKVTFMGDGVEDVVYVIEQHKGRGYE